MPGRNEPCPCGSGTKFKHCHGSERAQRVAVEKAVERMQLVHQFSVAADNQLYDESPRRNLFDASRLILAGICFIAIAAFVVAWFAH